MDELLEKPGVEEVANRDNLNARQDEVGRIDALATAPDTTLQSFAHLDEKKILRKMDMRLIPMLAILYLLSFLDRGNIGNAKIEGLQEDLQLNAAFEVPSNIMLKRLRPSRWLPFIMVVWGAVVRKTLMGIVQNFQGLLATRLFLGVAEAGLYPGCAYYLTMWYCRREIQQRQAAFFSAASIAGAFSGLLAYAISKLDGVGGLAGWRWISILEGLATVVVACAAFFLLYDFPETATFLTEEERTFVIFRLKFQGQSEEIKEERQHIRVAEAEDFQWKYVRDAFTDWQVWVNVIVYWGIVCPLYGISLFLPTIVKNLGYTSSTAQLLTVPIYVVAAILAIIVAYFSDRVGKRGPFVIGCMLVIIVGYALCLSTGRPGVIYAGVFIAAAGIYPGFAGNIAWLSNNLAGGYKRSAAMAIQIGAGNLGGAFASNFYRSHDSPRFILGHALELAFATAGIIAASILILGYVRANRKRAKIIREGGHNVLSPEELSSQGDKAVTFRYIY
ncbi:MFS general substrate transporter [Xylariaceae sp. FL1272]|nr:MFS general substrate transporter [Xylariaceae sp. FL1272]